MRALGLYLCALLASVHGASCGNECTRSSSISCTSGQVQEKQDSSCSTFGTGCGVTFRSDCFECCDPGECTCSNLKAFVDTLPNCTSTTELLSQVGMWRANNNCTALTPLFDGDEVFDNVTETTTYSHVCYPSLYETGSELSWETTCTHAVGYSAPSPPPPSPLPSASPSPPGAPSSPSYPETSSDSGSSGAAIAGVVLGSLALVVAVATAVYFRKNIQDFVEQNITGQQAESVTITSSADVQMKASEPTAERT